MLAVEKVPLQRLLDDHLEAMMHAHWRECSIDQEEVPLDPDFELALKMERCGILVCFGLYRHEHLVGYSAFEVSTHLHFKSTKYGFNSGTYVLPDHRGFGGVFLMQRAEELLKEMGVVKVVYLAPYGSALNGVLRRLGYTPSETYHTKLLTG